MSVPQRPHRPRGRAAPARPFRPRPQDPCRKMKRKTNTTRAKAASAPARRADPGIPAGAPLAWAARLRKLRREHERFLSRRNPVDRSWDNGVFERFLHPVITHRHAPIEWRFDLNPKTNPFLMERLGVNATLNPGAFLWHGKVHLVVRFEGYDRKSIFAIAESR